MKSKFLILFIFLFSLLTYSQEKYKFRENIESTNEKIKSILPIIENEFGAASSPGIWTSHSPDYGLMIRTKDNTFTISAWQISDNSDIKSKIDKVMPKIKAILE